MRHVLERALRGIKWGLMFASVLSLFVTAVYLFGGSAPFSAKGVTWAQVVLLYFAGGIVGGALVGLLLPLASTTTLGAGFVGWLASIPIGAGGAMLVSGPVWSSEHTFLTAFMSLGGIATGINLRRVLGKRRGRGLSKRNP